MTWTHTGTLLSLQPIHRYSGLCWLVKRLKKSGSLARISAAHCLRICTDHDTQGVSGAVHISTDEDPMKGVAPGLETAASRPNSPNP